MFATFLFFNCAHVLYLTLSCDFDFSLTYILHKIIETIKTKQVNLLVLPLLTTTMFSTTFINIWVEYATFTLARPFTVKLGNELVNSSSIRFAIIMVAKWQKTLTFFRFSQLEGNAKKYALNATMPWYWNMFVFISQLKVNTQARLHALTVWHRNSIKWQVLNRHDKNSKCALYRELVV